MKTVRIVLKSVVALLVVGVLVVGAGAVSGLAAPLPAATVHADTDWTLNTDTSITVPDSVGAAVGFSDGGDLLASNDPDGVRSIGSIAKVVTALVVLQEKPIDSIASSPTITLNLTDVGFYNSYSSQGGSVEEALVGMELSEYQVLQLALIASANNYAATAANWAFGSVDAFLSAANVWLQDNGLTSTVLTDPAGLDSGTVSTPRDLVALGRLAMANETVAGIVSQSWASIPTVGTIGTTNQLLGTSGVNGIKTGTTISAGHCLLFSVDAGDGASGSPVIGVILGEQNSDQLYADASDLASTISSLYSTTDIVTEGDMAALLSTEWSDSSTLEYTETVSQTVVGPATVNVQIDGVDNVVSVADEEDLGSATITVTDLRGESTYTVPLQARGSMARASVNWQLQHALRWIPDDVLPWIGFR